MNLTRTQLGTLLVFAATILAFAAATVALADPETVRGLAAGGDGNPFSPLVIATLLLTAISFLATLVGISTTLSVARQRSTGHFVASLLALALFIGGIAVPIIAGGGAGSYARTGDQDAYYRTLQVSSVAVAFSSLAVPALTWHLFKLPWRRLLAFVAVFRVVGGIGEVQAIRQHSTLAARTIQGQSVYLPRFDVPLSSGPLYTWQIVNWIGLVLLGGLLALLIFDASHVRQSLADADIPDLAPQPAES